VKLFLGTSAGAPFLEGGGDQEGSRSAIARVEHRGGTEGRTSSWVERVGPTRGRPIFLPVRKVRQGPGS